MTSDRSLILSLLRLARRQERLITELRQAFGTLGAALLERNPTIIPELERRLEEFKKIEKEELADDVETREQWDSWIELRERELLSGKSAPIQ